jgi:hypothetical protein
MHKLVLAVGVIFINFSLSPKKVSVVQNIDIEHVVNVTKKSNRRIFAKAMA